MDFQDLSKSFDDWAKFKLVLIPESPYVSDIITMLILTQFCEDFEHFYEVLESPPVLFDLKRPTMS